MEHSELIMLSVVALLVAYLYVRQRRRLRDREARWRWPGHGIDVRNLSQRVERVRHDYLSEGHARPQNTCIRRRALAAARRTVLRLSYFKVTDTVPPDYEESRAG